MESSGAVCEGGELRKHLSAQGPLSVLNQALWSLLSQP